MHIQGTLLLLFSETWTKWHNNKHVDAVPLLAAVAIWISSWMAQCDVMHNYDTDWMARNSCITMSWMALQIPQEVYQKLFDKDFQWMLQLVDIEYLSAFLHQLLQTHLYISAVLAKMDQMLGFLGDHCVFLSPIINQCHLIQE